MIATFTTKAIVGNEVGQEKKNTNKSRGTLIFMRENTHSSSSNNNSGWKKAADTANHT